MSRVGEPTPCRKLATGVSAFFDVWLSRERIAAGPNLGEDPR